MPQVSRYVFVVLAVLRNDLHGLELFDGRSIYELITSDILPGRNHIFVSSGDGAWLRLATTIMNLEFRLLRCSS
jgi:hypothetical protein